MADPNRALFESVVRLLAPVLDELVFVGGCTTGLFITDPAASGIRPTRDVDAIVDVASYAKYTALSERLRTLGLAEDTTPGAPLCRWRRDDLIVDVMPVNEDILGLSNRWYLTPTEIDALLAAPDVTTWIGRRDRALLLLAIQTGLRVSEISHLRCRDIVLGTGAHLRCEGKGRKQRCTPLQRDMVGVLTAWLRERNGQPGDPLFSTARGSALSRDAVERLVARHVHTAQGRCPSLKRKRISPHVLRHTAAMELLGHGVDRAVIALWLGHESVETTQMYLHADMRLKEQALARTTPTNVKPGRYRPPDQLLAFLERL